jgi:hypothetical protein
VELADGTHFEELGLYELVRRKLEIIVVVDATLDLDCEFAPLKKTIQRIRAELDVVIDVPLECFAEARRHKRRYGCSVGTICYPGSSKPATLVYFKAAPPGACDQCPEDESHSSGVEHAGFSEGSEFEEQLFAGYRAGQEACRAIPLLSREGLGAPILYPLDGDGRTRGGSHGQVP